MKYCVEPMRQRGGGSIIAVSSAAGVVGYAGGGAYVASKHAVNGLVKTAALELGEAKIRVNAIAPGVIDNQMFRRIAAQFAPENPAGVRDGMAALTALKRHGTSEEVANLALFLASDESTYCTGAVHVMDGGYTAA